MLVEKTFLDYTNLFLPSDFKKSDSIISNYFKDSYDKRKRSP